MIPQQTERIPAQHLDTDNIFHHAHINDPEPRDLRVVLDVMDVPDGPRVYAVGDPETGDYETMFAAEPTDTVYLYSHHGL